MALLPPWPFLVGGAAAVEIKTELDGDVLDVRYATGEPPLVDAGGALWVRRGPDGLELVVPRACEGWVAASGRLVTLAELRQCGVTAVPLGPRTEALVRVGKAQYRIAGTTPPRRQPLDVHIAWSRSLALTLVALAGCFFALWMLGEPQPWRRKLELADVRHLRVTLSAPGSSTAATRAGLAWATGQASARAQRSAARSETAAHVEVAERTKTKTKTKTQTQTQTQSETQAQTQAETPNQTQAEARAQRDEHAQPAASTKSATSLPAAKPAAPVATLDHEALRALARTQALSAGALGAIGPDGRQLLGARFASFAEMQDPGARTVERELTPSGGRATSTANGGNASSSDGNASGSDGNASGSGGSAGGSSGDMIGEVYGIGDLGLSGTGSGGGGSDVGTIGLGSLGTIGQGGGEGSGIGYGSGAAGLGGRHAAVVSLQGSAATVRGNCGRDWIRRVVRAHLNEVRFCYERALVSDPALAGRVVEQFVIAPSGRVLTASVAATTLDDSDVPACVNEALQRWLFPGCDGAVQVSYPFVFVPAGE